MGSIPNGSAPLQACARQIFNSMLPGRTGKAQVRLAAAGRLRSAVALELAAGKVWALPIAVQPARGTRCSKGTGHPEWVRCHGPRAGRRFPPRLRKGGAASVLGRLGNPSSRSWRSEYPLLAQDGEAGPRAGLSRPGQPRRQSDGSRSTVSAVP